MTLRDLADVVAGWLNDDRVDAAVPDLDPDDLAPPGTWQAWELALRDGTLARLTVEVRP